MAMNGKRGFGSMDPAKHREIARLAGKKAHADGNAHEFTSEEARRAGAKGGRMTAARRAGRAEEQAEYDQERTAETTDLRSGSE